MNISRSFWVRMICACTVALLPVAMVRAEARDRPAHAEDGAAAIVIYDIRQGDTLSQLARTAFNPGPKSLAIVQRLNRIGNPDIILTRKTLRLPRAILRDERTGAKVEATSGPILVRAGSQAVIAKVGAELKEGSSIDTGRNAFVTLRLPDGSTVSIPSESKIRIVRLRRVILTGSVEREFAIEEGHLRAKVTPMPDRTSTFRVLTPLTVSAVRGTEFRIDYDAKSGQAATEVEAGKVATGRVASKANILVLPGFGAAASKSGITGLIPLIGAPALTDPDQVQTQPELSFALNPVPGATGYHVQIARDAGMLDVVAEDRSALPQLGLSSVASGTYFARVSAIDALGIEGLPRIFAFDRFRNALRGTMTSRTSGAERSYLFKWQSDADGVPRYRFRLMRLDANRPVPVVDEVALGETGMTVTDLPAAEYSWRILSILNIRGRLLETWSPEQRFTVSGKK